METFLQGQVSTLRRLEVLHSRQGVEWLHNPPQKRQGRAEWLHKPCLHAVHAKSAAKGKIVFVNGYDFSSALAKISQKKSLRHSKLIDVR